MLFCDTIVIGAGSAGAVIAARVTERADREVLLLEAGPDYFDQSMNGAIGGMAGLPPELVDGTRNARRTHDWRYSHKPNSRQLRFPLPRGRVVGGSSAVNTCIAVRGQPSDYDEWAARGLWDWTWAKCLPAFKRLENDLDIQNQWHGQDGPIPIRRHPREELVPWQAAFLDACAALGFPGTPDHNDPGARGFGPHAMNKIDGRRMNAALCYLTPAVRARENFALLPNTEVRRVVVERGRAVGVEVDRNGQVMRFGARRIVLSAGAINTPGLLLRSGIGSRERVERIGADLICEVPAVAARLLDHPGVAFLLLPRRGLASPLHPIIQTALRVDSGRVPSANDIQIQAGSWVNLFGWNTPFVSMMSMVGKPRGHGEIEFIGSGPHVQPRIRSRLLDDEFDRAIAVQGLQIAFDCVQTKEMRDLARPIWPSPRVLADAKRFNAVIRRFCDSGYHPCGTVPMGAEGDKDAAVDQHGRVRGVEGLYVADASIMPTIPTSNINLPTLMIGERFGEWLRDGVI